MSNISMDLNIEYLTYNKISAILFKFDNRTYLEYNAKY